MPEPTKRKKSLRFNTPLVSRRNVIFVFIVYEQHTATDHDITFDKINGSASRRYAAVKTEKSIDRSVLNDRRQLKNPYASCLVKKISCTGAVI